MNEILKNVFRFLIQETNNSNQIEFIFIILYFSFLFIFSFIAFIAYKHIFEILKGDNENE